MQLLTSTATLTEASTSKITFRQLGGQWLAAWEDFDLGITYELRGATKTGVLRKALRQQRETEILKQIERCMDFLVEKGWLSAEADTWLTDALFTH